MLIKLMKKNLTSYFILREKIQVKLHKKNRLDHYRVDDFCS